MRGDQTLRHAEGPWRERGRARIRQTLFLLLPALCLVSAQPASAIQTPDARSIDSLPQLALRETLRIGSSESPDLGFTRIGAVAVDSERRIYVVETMDLTIRVFSSQGALLRTIGRRGDGPGEFRTYPSLGVAADTVWALDARQNRITLFDTTGSVLSTGTFRGVEVPLQDPAWNGVVTPQYRGADGLFVGRMYGMRRRTDARPNAVGRNDTVAVPLVRFAASGEVVDTVGWDSYPPRRVVPEPEVEVRGSRYRVPQPPTGDPVKLDSPDGQWIVEAPLPTSRRESSFWVTRRDIRGDTVFRREYRYTPRRYTSEVLDSIAFRTTPRPATISFTNPTQAMSASEVRTVQGAVRRAMRFPEFQPPIRHLEAGQDGTLWLQREENGASTSEWIVLWPDGEPKGVVTLGQRQGIAWHSGQELLIVESDEWDVPWLVRCSFVHEGVS